MIYCLFTSFLIYQIKGVFSSLALDIDLRTNNCGKYTGAKWVSCRQPVSWMKMNGKTVMHLLQGWNLAVVDHKTGKIEKTSNFPTFRSISANIQLEKFVESIEDKRIVLGVVHHDGSRFLDSRGERALKTVTGRNFIVKRLWWSFAFIGYKDSFAIPKEFSRVLARSTFQGGGRIKVTIGKIKYGNDMYFALMSMGYLDRNCRARSQMKSFVRYGNTVTKLSYGLLIMVVDHMSGDVHDVKSFNTHHSRKESDRLTKYIRWLPRGMIVLGVVHSDWTAYSTPQLNTALLQLFFTHVPTTRDGSWAMVGYTGGRSALPYNDFPVSRMTLTKSSSRLPVFISYFTNIRDIDECSNGEATCGKNTVCRNTIGSYECDCKTGFKKKGSGCIDIDECIIGVNICGSRAACQNTPGSYICRCKDTKENLLLGIRCKEVTIKISGPNCYHQKPGKPALCRKLPIKIEINGENVLKTPKRGYKIVVINSHSGKVEKVSHFDTWLHDNEFSKLSTHLKTIPNHKIVVGAVYNDENLYMPTAVNQSVRQLTGYGVPIKFIGALAFVGFKGPVLPHWTRLKSTKVFGGSVILEQRFWALSSPPYTPIKVTSVGYRKSKSEQASIQIGNKKLSGGQLKQGFNLAIVDGWSGTLEVLRSFNTHKKGASDIRKMELFLNSLPTDRLVVGVVKGEAFQGLRSNQRPQIAIHRLLGAPMNLKSVGGSFAFIGSTYTGTVRKPGFVEQVAMNPGKGPAELVQTIQFGRRAKVVNVHLLSTGCNDMVPQRDLKKCHFAPVSLKVDGKEQSVKGRGINVVVVSQINGRTLSRNRFDTAKSFAEAYRMANFIESLPPTAIVLGAVKDNARGNFFNNTKLMTAMTQILGRKPAQFPIRGSYVFIGYKGIVKHRWVKQSHQQRIKGGIHMSAKIPLIPEIKIELQSSSCREAMDSRCFRAKSSIVIHGKEYSKNKRGFNLAVVNIQNGVVERRENFDTFSKSLRGSAKMVQFVNSLPVHRIVVGVVKGDAYQGLTAEAKKAIAKLIKRKGIAMYAHLNSYAFIGFTSAARYYWTKDLGGPIRSGPTKLTASIPFMQLGCTFPIAPKNGRVRRVEYDVSEDAEYRCYNGLEVTGKPQSCGKNGVWQGIVPKCGVPKFSEREYESPKSSSSRLIPTILVNLFLFVRVIYLAVSLIIL